MKTAVAYTRVSSDDQIKGTSLGTQLAEIKTYCERHDITILSHYEDAGESAKTADRPGLIKALDDCRKKKASFLIVHRLDRLSRNATDGLAIRAKLASHQTQLLSVSEPISDDPAGQFMSAIMFASAQFDNDIRSARSRSGMTATTAKGGWNYHAPYGFKIARRADGLPVLEISSPDASRLTTLLKTYASGASSLTATIAGFKALGLDRGKANRIFHEPIYGGIIRTRLSNSDILAAFPGYVTPQTWYKLEARYAEDKRKPRRDKPSHVGFHLSLCTCSVCGSRLKGSNSRSKNGRLYPYYRCPQGHANIRAADLVNATEDAIATLAVISEKLAKSIEIALDFMLKKGNDLKRVEHQRIKDIESYKDKLSKLAEKYIDGDFDQPTYKALQAKYNGKIAELEQNAVEIVDPQSYFDRAVLIFNTFKNIRDVWRKMDSASQKRLLLALPVPPRYNPDSKKVELDFDQAGVDKNAFSPSNVQMAPLARLMSHLEAISETLKGAA